MRRMSSCSATRALLSTLTSLSKIPYFITLAPTKLFDSQHNEPRSASIYWKDSEYVPRVIESSDIVGVGKGPFGLKDVSLVCSMTLTTPTEVPLRQRRQYCFQDSDSPSANLLCPTGYGSNGNTGILGCR
jgi:hypothetical protein